MTLDDAMTVMRALGDSALRAQMVRSVAMDLRGYRLAEDDETRLPIAEDIVDTLVNHIGLHLKGHVRALR